MTKAPKLTVPIKGMHCKSCEILVEDQLKEIKGVEKVVVNHRQDLAEIYYGSTSPDLEAIRTAVEKAGYSLGKEQKSGWFSKNPTDYQELGVAALVLLALYYFFKSLGLTSLNLLPSGNDSSITIWLILLIGLIAGFSTCMALVGGLVLGLAARHNELHPEAASLEKFRPHLFFNAGRIIAYACLGGLLGIIGSAFQLSSLALGIVTIAVGLLMMAIGLQLVGIFPWAKKIKLTLPKSLTRLFGLTGQPREYSHKSAMILGGLTFFLPCGFTQAMQVLAIATGSFAYGALVMGLFAIGTLPGLLGIGGLTSVVKGSAARRFYKAAGLAVIAFALFNISNGFNLTGFTFNQKTNIQINDPNVTIENGVQVVRMKELANGYSPNQFTIKAGVPVKWIIDAQAPFSCAATIILPKYQIRKNLARGENIIKFTPSETGRLPFSCGMGMYTGAFNVVDKNGEAPSSVNLNPTANANAAVGGCGGGSGGGCRGGGGQGSCSGSGCGCGGQAKIKPDATPTQAQSQNNVQVINSLYTASGYLQPNTFKVKAGQKARLNIDVRDSGRGCGQAIMIPGLYNQAVPLAAGQPISLEFTPKSQGQYNITCSMGMIIYGTIIVE